MHTHAHTRPPAKRSPIRVPLPANCRRAHRVTQNYCNFSELLGFRWMIGRKEGRGSCPRNRGKVTLENLAFKVETLKCCSSRCLRAVFKGVFCIFLVKELYNSSVNQPKIEVSKSKFSLINKRPSDGQAKVPRQH